MASEITQEKNEKAMPPHMTEEGSASGDQDFESTPQPEHKLQRNLKGRHMQMIAIGGSIGAGLFVGSGKALLTGGPASVLIGFIVTGAMLLFTVQALGEMAVLYPVNGAFFQYACRFIDDSWGFAMGWDYAIGWLTVLPFELTAASITIDFWQGGANVNKAVWISVFLAFLCIIQIFGVRGYGEVEFFLSLIKIVAVCGFIIFGIIVNCGGVPTDHRGYIGTKYWHDPGAFRNGFKGFCTVFVTAAFAFGGTELVGLAAAEAANPRKTLPSATKQVFWRITFFYIVSLFILGLILPSDDPNLLGSSGANTKASPFVLAIQMANVKVLPSIFNAVITISVISVANSCTYASTRTMQALSLRGMGPRFLTFVDKAGRPIWAVLIQLGFGGLAYINLAGDAGDQVFTWLLSLSGLSFLFVWGSICFSHIRFRAGWKAQGHTLDELPFKAQFGVIGSWIGFLLAVICLVATFYTALLPVGEGPDTLNFFEQYLAGPVVIALYLFWKCMTRFRGGWWVKAEDMDITSGMRQFDIDALEEAEQRRPSIKNLPARAAHALV